MGRLKDTTMNLFIVSVALRRNNDHIHLSLNVRAMNEDEAKGKAYTEAMRENPSSVVVTMVAVKVDQALLDWAQNA